MSYLHKKAKKRWMLKNKENKDCRQQSLEILKMGKNTSISQKLKTQPNDDGIIEQIRQTLISPSCELVKQQRPFLENKKIIFNTRGMRGKQQSINIQRKKKKDGEQTNIDKLKREIQELDKDDFISYRSRTNSYMVDDMKMVQNARISKYNHENSLIVQLKGQTCFYKPIINRPRTTISNSGKVSRNSANFSMPHKYFSKPKKKTNPNDEVPSQTTEVLGEAIINTTKLKMKPEQLFIGLNNMLRGHTRHKKYHSQFCFI